jgi:ribonuclease P protein component
VPLQPSNTTLPLQKTGRFLRRERIVRRGDYVRIQGLGRRVRTSHFVFMLMPWAGERRLGITVTSKIGCAVERNRVKRVAKEVFRRNRELFPEHSEIVVVARFGAHRLGYHAFLGEVQGAQKTFAEYIRHNSAVPRKD